MTKLCVKDGVRQSMCERWCVQSWVSKMVTKLCVKDGV